MTKTAAYTLISLYYNLLLRKEIATNAKVMEHFTLKEFSCKMNFSSNMNIPSTLSGGCVEMNKIDT